MAIKEILMDALKEAASIFNKTGDPNQAIIKTASERDFNSDQVTRLVELFNTVTALNHYKSASDKTATFPIADADTIMVQLFDPEKLAMAETRARGLYDYSEYAQAEDGIIVEAEDVTMPEMHVYDDKNLDTVIAYGYRAADILKHTADDCDKTAGMAEVVIGRELEKIATHIRKEWREKGDLIYSELVKCAYLTYSDPVIPYLSILEGYLPNNKLVKCANLVDDRKYAFVLSKLGELIKMGNDAVTLREEAQELRTEVAAFEKDIIDSFKPEYSEISLFKSGQQRDGQEKQKPSMLANAIPQAVNELKGMFNPTMKAIGDRSNKDISNSLVNSLMSGENRAAKKHEEDMANLERQSILEDLITNDPVLSGIEPEKIVSGYQAIMRLSPEVSRNKEVVRAQLRQLAHSIALSPFDAKQLVDLESVIRRNAAPSSQGVVQPAIKEQL